MPGQRAGTKELIAGSGHWVAEEQPTAFLTASLNFDADVRTTAWT